MAADSDLSALEGHDDSQAEMMSERCILVDADDLAIGSATKIECHHGIGKRHRAFSVLHFDSKDRILLQR